MLWPIDYEYVDLFVRVIPCFRRSHTRSLQARNSSSPMPSTITSTMSTQYSASTSYWQWHLFETARVMMKLALALAYTRAAQHLVALAVPICHCAQLSR